MTRPDPDDSSPEADVARFLSSYKIPDHEFALGLDLMARDVDEKRHDLVFIDYKSLGVRQLGSIYEGLLEFKLRIAPVDMAIVKGKKTEEVVSYTEAQQKKLTIVKEGRGKEAQEKVLLKGTVYLENDRRERKATGSYYTPDYIVKYIVEHTVGPVLEEKLEALRPIFREAEKTLKGERDKARALGRKDINPENETYKKFRKTLNDTFFDLKVLDPAMGSGHFLVEAVDYITDQMAKILTAFKWNTIVHELAQTRNEIQEEMELQGVTIDVSKLTDLNLLKRRVLKSCIYGVDLNPMAVELAKVSLWLDCFTLGAPLSFLDHHMKCGNSLIGSNVKEVQDALDSGLWGNQFAYLLDATQLMRKVGELSDVTSQEVAASRAAYKGAYDALAPFKRLLDVWISDYFGNKGAQRITQDCAEAIYDDTYGTLDQQEKDAIETALALAQSKRFFHWELEFPEVFFDETKRKENGGFDSVVGNPPYVRIQGLKENDPAQVNYYGKIYGAATQNYDIYVLFVEKATQLINCAGIGCFIIPHKFTQTDFGKGLREVLVRQSALKGILSFGANQLFEDASTYSSILQVSKQSDPHWYFAEIGLHAKPNTTLPEVLKNTSFETREKSKLDSAPWVLSPSSNIDLLMKIQQSGITLANICEKIFVGLQTSADTIYFLERTSEVEEDHIRAFSKALNKEVELEMSILRPLLRGKDVHRYEAIEAETWVLFPYYITNGSAHLYTATDLKNLFPLAWAYLKARAVR